MRHIVLCGMMGAGKSYLARKFSYRNKIPFFDLDNEIEKGENRSIQSIFKMDSEEMFRSIEKRYLRKILMSRERSIVALGAGTIISDRNRKILKKQTIQIYIKTNLDIILERLKHDKKRPLVQNKNQLKKTIEDLLKKREPFYMEANYIFENLDIEKSLNQLDWTWNEHIKN